MLTSFLLRFHKRYLPPEVAGEPNKTTNTKVLRATTDQKRCQPSRWQCRTPARRRPSRAKGRTSSRTLSGLEHRLGAVNEVLTYTYIRRKLRRTTTSATGGGGVTSMLIIISNSRDVTADYLAERIRRAGGNLVRFDTDRSLAGRLRYDAAGPRLEIGGRPFPPISTTCGIAAPNASSRQEGRLPRGEIHRGRVDRSDGRLFAHIPKPRWMNHPSAEAAASQKLEQLTRAAHARVLRP